MRNLTFILGVIIFAFSCGENKEIINTLVSNKTEFDKGEISNIDSNEIGEYISVKYVAEIIKDSIEIDTELQEKNNSEAFIIEELLFDYKDLKPFFKFQKVKNLDSVYSSFDTEEFNEIFKFKKIEFEFEDGHPNEQYTDLDHYLLGTFVWKNTEFYVFYRFYEACGYYNGFSLFPVNGEKEFIDINGGFSEAGQGYWTIMSDIVDEKMIYTLNMAQIESDTNIKGELIFKHLTETTIGNWEYENDILVKKGGVPKEYTVLYDEDHKLIDTLNSIEN